jgi:hypothetical protein
MRKSCFLFVLGCLLVGGFCCSERVALGATPGFTVAATNVTESSSGLTGTGTSSITLTSVGGYIGSVQVICYPPTVPNGVKLPYCNGPIADPTYNLTANQTVTGRVSFYNQPVPEAAVSRPRLPSRLPASGLALAGVLLWGIAARRKAGRTLVLMLFAAGTLTCLAGISGCGGTKSAVTPGTYVYTITATDTRTASFVSSSINVTVP